MRISHRAATIALPFALIGCAHSAREAPFRVVVRGPAATCSITVNGRVVTKEELLAIARKKVKSTRRASIHVEARETPYRCIGGTIYTLQTAGFGYLDFAGQSPFADTKPYARE